MEQVTKVLIREALLVGDDVADLGVVADKLLKVGAVADVDDDQTSADLQTASKGVRECRKVGNMVVGLRALRRGGKDDQGEPRRA